MIKLNTIAILIAAMIDLLLGDPVNPLHPVRIMGRAIARLDRVLNIESLRGKEKYRRGMIAAIIIPAASFAIGCLISYTAYRLGPVIYLLVEAVLMSQLIAARDLAKEALRVGKALAGKRIALPTGKINAPLIIEGGRTDEERLASGRKALSWIVGRDTGSLDRDGVIRAAVETVAENTSDGVIAPMIYMLLGGLPLALAYKAVNTLDSMLGYKNDKYLFFGRASARSDDIWNYLPSRLSAIMICIAAILPGYSMTGAFRIWRRDRRKHDSPNSAQTESACAGAMGLRLAGDAYYGGKLKKKEYIGDAIRSIELSDISSSCVLMLASSGIMLALGLAARMLVIFLIGE